MNGTTEPPVVSGFGHLVEQEILPLQRYARALTRDRERADDLVQTCLTRALARQHLWQPGTALRAWLFTILHNAWVSLLRSAAREQARREITVALLTPAARIALEGMGYPQAAAAVGARVRSRMGRARGRLRAQLSRPAAAAKRCDCNSAVAPV